MKTIDTNVTGTVLSFCPDKGGYGFADVPRHGKVFVPICEVTKEHRSLLKPWDTIKICKLVDEDRDRPRACGVSLKLDPVAV